MVRGAWCVVRAWVGAFACVRRFALYLCRLLSCVFVLSVLSVCVCLVLVCFVCALCFVGALCARLQISQRTVARFDHFCVWIAQPVGERNYKYFLFFLFMTCVYMIYAAVQVSCSVTTRRHVCAVSYTHLTLPTIYSV